MGGRTNLGRDRDFDDGAEEGRGSVGKFRVQDQMSRTLDAVKQKASLQNQGFVGCI
ncbi:hypothetical protein BH10PSE5_BH10PSE5_34280 [soil metagenome]